MKNNLKRKLGIGIVSLSAVALLAACGDTGTTEEPAVDDPATEEPATNTSNGLYGMEFDVSLEEAVQIFHDTFGEDIRISNVDFENDRGEYDYQLSGWDETSDYELDVDAMTGEISEFETERESDRDSNRDNTLDFDAIISPAEAMDAAVDASGSDQIEDWSLEEENGVTIYEINIENGDDVTVDAETGNVLEQD